MEMLITTAGFLAITAILVWRHLQRSEGGKVSGAAAVPMGPPCPRCQASVPVTAAFCPGCGVPRQIYEVVSAPAATGAGNDTGGRLHALVRADLCVGCGTCVAACPEPGAMTMQGKMAVVNQQLCVGHGECVKACPVGGILMTTGAAVHRVEVPDVGGDFQTNIPGLYIVGELGGRGLIKNAVNEGKIAAEHVARELPACEPRPDGDPEAYDLVVVGSGPAGLSAALEAHKSGLKYVVLEQGSLSDSVRKYPRHKLLFAEPLNVPLYGDLWIADASKESLLQVWETIVANTGLAVRTGHRVDTIVRRGPLFDVAAAGFHVKARRVILAMGRRGTPRRLEVPGEDLGKVVYDVAEMEDFKGRRVLVVGGGDSAIESAVGLANQPGTTVTLSYRGESFQRAKDRNRDKLEAAAAAGKVTILLKSAVREIRPEVVVLEVDGESAILPNDDVIVRIGGDAPHAFLRQIGVRIVEKDIPLAGVSKAG